MKFINKNINHLLKSLGDKKTGKKLAVYGSAKEINFLTDYYSDFDLKGRTSRVYYDSEDDNSLFYALKNFVMIFTTNQMFVNVTQGKYRQAILSSSQDFYIGDSLLHNPPDYDFRAFSGLKTHTHAERERERETGKYPALSITAGLGVAQSRSFTGNVLKAGRHIVPALKLSYGMRVTMM